MNCLSLGMFSSVGSNGNSGGSGVIDRVRQPQGALDCSCSSSKASTMSCREGGIGKSGLITPKSISQHLLTNTDFNSETICKSCLDEWPGLFMIETFTGTAPKIVNCLPSATFKVTLDFIKSETEYPNL